MAFLEPKTLQLGENLLLDVRPGSDEIRVRMIGVGGREVACTIKKTDLWSAVFAIMDGKQQDDLMPVRQTTMMTMERMNVVRVKRDLKKGDILKFKTTFDVPLAVVESLKGQLLPSGVAARSVAGETIHTPSTEALKG